MNNNDVLRRLRYSFDYDDTKMIGIFANADLEVSRTQVCAWLKAEDEADQADISDSNFASFLNGLIVEKRGKKDGPEPEPESRLNNNIVFMKLKIALNLKAEDVLALLESKEFSLSKHELSAFFRKSANKHYRECKDQVLRIFLQGLQAKLRPSAEPLPVFEWKTPE